MRDLPPALFCALRQGVAGAVLLCWALWRGHALPRGRDWRDLAAVAVLLLVVGNGTLAWAEQWVPTGIASLIVVATPLWMAVFARLSGEPVGRRAASGLLLGFAGIGVLLWPDLGRVRPEAGFLKATLGLLASSAIWAYGSVYSKRRPARTEPVMSIAVQMLIGSGVFAALGVLVGEPARWRPTRESLLAVANLVVLGSIVGYGSYIYALSKLSTVNVSVYVYINTVVAVLLGVLVLGERFDPFLAVGIPLALGGVYLVDRDRTERVLAETVARSGPER